MLNNWWGILLGIGIGVILGYLNYLQIRKSIASEDPKATLKKGSFPRFIFIFIGLYLAIRLGGFASLAAAVLSLLGFSAIFIFLGVKNLSSDKGDKCP